ncbi:MAG: hypothetical protein P1V51_19060 [Deltaproteobacteria bacterium]|nr:hypothetical protein [Deltaproteobacteria bacterium]
MGAATPHRPLRGPILLAALAGALLVPPAALAEEGELPDDRQALEAPGEKATDSAGFELPPPPGEGDPAAEPAVDPMIGWESDDPRIARREKRMLTAGSAYGFAGAFAGFAVWTLITSSTFTDERPRRDWRTASLVFAGLSAVGLTVGTIAWATAPSPPKTMPEGASLSLIVAPNGAKLRLRFF